MQHIGRYEIEDRIGDGAMADVYRAFDPGIGRRIAIKVLKPELRDNPEIADRFLREARAAGALSHPNIVTIHDVGSVDGHPYIAMELLEGIPLDRHLREHGALPMDSVLTLGIQLAHALHYAHEAGIIHRDIKPANIILCDEGRTAKILDFGIARVSDPDPLRAEINALRTQIGHVLGTPRYMSPEQALGLAIDRRSDLFSLGVVLYELATGKMAFDGTSLATIAIQITQQQPQPLSAVLPGCPRGLHYIVGRLLAKQPGKRYATAVEVADALERERDALDRTPRRPGLPINWRLGLTIGATVGVALLISIFAILDRQYRSLEQMALTSGATVTTFVANNVGLRAVENAGLAAAQQDWAPVQAFIDVAVRDSGVRRISVVDGSGIVRASSEPRLLGGRETRPVDETPLSQAADMLITRTAQDDFRIRRTIRYADRPFGSVELLMSGSELAAATRHAQQLMTGVALILAVIVMLVSYAAARTLTRPIRQLGWALEQAAQGKTQFRISHRRRDEFGALFEAYNRLADRLENLEGQAESHGPALEATRIAATPVVAELRRAG